MMMSELDGFSAFSTINNVIAQQPISNPNPIPIKKKRNLPGTPDPEAEVIAMSPKSLMAKNRFMCEICNKGFQRDQNLQLHRRGHNLPWKLKQRTSKEVRKKVYVCPEKSCVHHDPVRALGDLTGIKKHYSRKHGEKKWKCEKCSKKYAVQSDWKAHTKICGTKEYKCDCGTVFSRKDSFITHRAFCDALAEENSRFKTDQFINNDTIQNNPQASTRIMTQFSSVFQPDFASASDNNNNNNNSMPNPINSDTFNDQKPMRQHHHLPLWLETSTNPNPFLAMSSNNFPDQSFIQENHHPLNVYQSLSNGNLSISPLISQKPKRDEEGEEEENIKPNLSEQVPTNSLYSAHMSATALLQKAAQMGSTRTATPTTLFASNAVEATSFGMNLSTLLSSNSFDGGQKMFGKTENEAENMNKVMGGGKEEGGQSLTRDFLGVGNHNVSNGAFLQHDHLLQLAAMGSNCLELSHYDENHGCH